MKIQTSDAFILNLKMISNDIARLEQYAERARNASNNDDDYGMGEDIVFALREIRHLIRDRILEDIG